MSLLNIKCFFGFHKECAKFYKKMYQEHPDERPRYTLLPFVHVYCQDSGKYIREEHMEDHDATKVTFFLKGK